MESGIVTGLLYLFIIGTTTFVIKDSVVFDKNSEIHTGRSFWKLTLVEDLETYTPRLELVNYQLEQLHNELRAIHEKIVFTHTFHGGEIEWAEHYDRLLKDYKDLRSDFEELNNEFDELRKLENNNNGRKRRSLLPFIGDITSFLFGTVTESDLNSVKRNLKFLANNQQKLTHVMNESLTMLNISRHEIKENRNQLNEVITAIRQLNEDLKIIQENNDNKILQLDQLIRIYLQSKSAFERAKSNVEVLFRHFRTFQIKLNRLAIGRLSPVVIKPNTLLYILRNIKNKLSLPLTLFRETEFNLWHYYKT